MRYAHVYDGPGPDNQPVIAPDHPRLEADMAERMAEYLRSATLVLRTSGLKPDRVDPSRRVAQSLFTDGVWYWKEEIVRYVGEYHLRPTPDFVAHCSELDFVPPQPTHEQVDGLLQKLGIRPAEMTP